MIRRMMKRLMHHLLRIFRHPCYTCWHSCPGRGWYLPGYDCDQTYHWQERHGVLTRLLLHH